MSPLSKLAADEAASLREQAKRALAERERRDVSTLTPEQMRAVLYELEVHKIELEIQNEQLRQSQLAADQSRERYRRLYEAAPVGYLSIDREGRIIDSNLVGCTLLGVTRSRLLGRKFTSFLAPRHQDRWHLEWQRLWTSSTRHGLELEIQLPAGRSLHAQLAASADLDEDPALSTVRVALVDVTDLRRAERALRRAAVDASLAEQRERQKLASDLHDDAGQLLSLACIKLRALRGEGAAGKPVLEVEEILAEARKRIASLTFQLSPPLLHDVGLVAAARWLAEDLQRRYGLTVKGLDVPELPDLDESARVTLYRALRELLLNVSKHSGVSEAHVSIWREGSMARVGVEDAGIGFSPESCASGFGLLALRERVEQLGGSLETRSTPGAGASVVARLPFVTSRVKPVREEK